MTLVGTCGPIYYYGFTTVWQYHVAFFVIGVLILIVLFLLLIWLGPIKKMQPVVSRGAVPYIGLVNNLFQIFVAIPQYATFEFRVRNFCYFKYFVEAPFQLISLLIIPMHLFRYLYINNIKESVYAESKADNPKEFIRSRFKIFKTLTSPLANGLTLFAVMAAWILGSIIYLAVFRFSCLEYLSSRFVDIVAATLYFIIAGLMVAVMIYDLVMNAKVIAKCDVWKLFVENDPFYFRLEFCMYIFAILLLVMDRIFALTLPSLIYLDVTVWLNSFILYTILYAQVGFSITIALYRILKEKIYGKKEIKEGKLESMLQNKKLRQMFTDFIRSEWFVFGNFWFNSTIGQLRI